MENRYLSIDTCQIKGMHLRHLQKLFSLPVTLSLSLHWPTLIIFCRKLSWPPLVSFSPPPKGSQGTWISSGTVFITMESECPFVSQGRHEEGMKAPCWIFISTGPCMVPEMKQALKNLWFWQRMHISTKRRLGSLLAEGGWIPRQ